MKTTKTKKTKPSRTIDPKVERVLWARAAGRCQFDGCNSLLYKSDLTQESINRAQMAHIWAFSDIGPRGNSGINDKLKDLNDVGNLFLVCHGCHQKIDKDKEGKRYSVELIRHWKETHEQRVKIVTSISATKKSHVLFYECRIENQPSRLSVDDAFASMFPDHYPADERPINLSMDSSLDDSTKDYFMAHAAHIKKRFQQQVETRIEEADPNHLSLFALAPQPLLIYLGTLLTDKAPTDVYQLHREPSTWKWQPHPEDFEYQILPPEDKTGTPVLLCSLSAAVNRDRITSVLAGKLSIWELTVANPHNDFLRSQAQTMMFRQSVRKALADIRAAYPDSINVKIFPAMPISCAVELGRARSPKADLEWTIYDQNNKHRKFIEALTIGGTNE